MRAFFPLRSAPTTQVCQRSGGFGGALGGACGLAAAVVVDVCDDHGGNALAALAPALLEVGAAGG